MSGIDAVELAGRRSALTERLAEQGIGAWIAFGDDRPFAGADHVRYLTNFAPHFEPVIVVGDATGAVTMLTGPETVGLAENETAAAPLSAIVAMRELVHPGLDYPSVPTVAGTEAILELVGGPARVGVLGAGAIPAHVHEAVIGPLLDRGVIPVAADDTAYALRAVKSPAEQVLLDEAFAIAAAGMLAAASAIRPGVTERQIAAVAELAMRERGAEGFGIETMVASGVRNTRTIPGRTTHRAVERGDLVTVTVVPRHEGYHACLGRPFVLGANAEAERWIDVAWEVQRAGRAELRAGVPGRVAAARCAEVVAASGCEAEIAEVWVHSTGIVEFEPPSYAASSGAVLGADCAVNIDVPLFSAPWGGLRIEDGFALQHGVLRSRLSDSEHLVPMRI